MVIDSYYGDEIARLRDELKLISDELSLSKSQVRQTRIQLSECQTEQLSAQLHNTRITREKELLEIRLSSVESLLNVKSIDYLQHISQSTNVQNDLEYTISSLKTSLNTEKKKTVALTDNYSLLEEKFDELLIEKGATDAKLIEQQFSLGREIQDAARMRDLYKRYFEEMGSKFEDLESRAEEDKMAYEECLEGLQQQQQAIALDAQALLDKQRTEMQAKISELEQQLLDAADESSSLKRSSYAAVTTIPPDEYSDLYMRGHIMVQDMDVSGLYNKAVLYEKRYLDERNRCIDLETFLQQLQQSHSHEISSVAEQIADHDRLTKAYADMASRLDASLVHIEQMRAQLAVLAPRARESELQNTLLQQQNKDLSRQLQHLLMRSQGAATGTSASMLLPDALSADDVISTQLLTFEDIAQLQTRNSQLILALRALSADEGDRLGEDLGSDAFAQQLIGSAGREKSRQLRELSAELEQMLVARRRAEAMVEQLMQQVETYKELISSNSSRPPASPQADGSPSNVLREQRARLSALENEVVALGSERKRLEAAEQSMAAAAEALRRECADLRASSAREGAAARVLQEKLHRSSEAHRSVSLEVSDLSQRLAGRERDTVDLTRCLRLSEERAARDAGQASSAMEELQQARCELQATRAAEQQLISRLVINNELLQKHVVLVESMQRIETGIQSKEKEQLESALHERDALLKSCKALRSELDARELSHDQRSRQMEQELSSTRARLDTATGDLSSARERLLREQGTTRTLLARAGVLERQNSIALERLGVLQGVPLDSFERPDLKAKELELEQAAVQIDSLRQQLALAETHLGEFERISSAAEQRWERAQHELEEMAAQRSSEQQLALEEQQRIQEQAHALQSREREHEKEKDRLRDQAAQLEEEVAEQARGAEALRHSLAEAQGYVDIFKAEMLKFQQTAKAAYASCEKEAYARQEAEARLSSQEAEQAVLREELLKLRSLELDESAAKSAHQGASEQLEGLRRVNDLLHGQVQSLGMQLGRARAQYTGVPGDRSDHMYVEEAAAGEEEGELDSAHRTAQDLREVIRYMKREKEGVEAKLVTQGTEMLHLKGSLAAAQRQLEDARVDLKRERERSLGGWSRGDQFDRLMVDITQNNLVREMNAKLRQQNEELLARAGSIEAELGEARAGSLPLRQEIQRLRAEKEALEIGLKEKGSEVLTLHRRLQQLLSRYEAVDPEIHRSLKSNLDEITSAVTAAKAEATAKEAEMTQIRLRHGSLEANQTKLRNKLREVLSQVDELKKEKADVEARRAESDERGDRLAKELAASGSRVAALSGELDTERALAAELASRHAAEEEGASRELDACHKELALLRDESGRAREEMQEEPKTKCATTASSSSATISKIQSKKRKEAAAASEAETEASPLCAEAAAANPLQSMKDRLFELHAARKNSIDKEREKAITASDASAERPPEAKKTKVQPIIGNVPSTPFNPFAAFAKQGSPSSIFGGGGGGGGGGALSASAPPFRPSTGNSFLLSGAAVSTPFASLAAAPPVTINSGAAASTAASLLSSSNGAKERAKAMRAHRFGLGSEPYSVLAAVPEREEGEEGGDDAEEEVEEEVEEGEEDEEEGDEMVDEDSWDGDV